MCMHSVKHACTKQLTTLCNLYTMLYTISNEQENVSVAHYNRKHYTVFLSVAVTTVKQAELTNIRQVWASLLDVVLHPQHDGRVHLLL